MCLTYKSPSAKTGLCLLVKVNLSLAKDYYPDGGCSLIDPKRSDLDVCPVIHIPPNIIILAPRNIET